MGDSAGPWVGPILAWVGRVNLGRVNLGRVNPGRVTQFTGAAVSPWKPLPGDVPEPRPVGDSLPALVRSLGAPAPSVLNAVFERWEDIVGTTIAAHAWPLQLRDGVLRIGVDQPAWAAQLAFLGPELVGKVVAATGDSAVDSLEVKVLPRRRV